MTTHNADSSEQSPSQVQQAGPRTSPIIWGVLVLAFCGYVAQRTFGRSTVDDGWWVIAIVIGLGVLLLGVGLAVVIRNRRR